MWPDFAKFRHFGKSLQVFGKMLSLLGQIFNIIVLIFIVANGPLVKNNLTIWSHCWLSLIKGQLRWLLGLLFHSANPTGTWLKIIHTNIDMKFINKIWEKSFLIRSCLQQFVTNGWDSNPPRPQLAILWFYLVFGKNLNLHRTKKCFVIAQILIAIYGQVSNNFLPIWSLHTYLLTYVTLSPLIHCF